MTMLGVSLSGPARACAAVTQALAALPLTELRASWTLRESEGRCEIVAEGRSSVASTWRKAVDQMLAPPAPLAAIRVRAPHGGGR